MLSLLKSYIDVNTIEGILWYSFLVLFISWALSRIFRFILIIFLERKQRQKRFGVTTLKFIKNSIRFTFIIIGVFVIIFTVPKLREQAGFIFSGAGILAAIIGFAAQSAISNLIAGLFIVIFKPFRVGDYIKLDDQRIGIVDDITLRHTVINNFENKRLIIPNSVISTESVLNHTIDDSKVLSFNNFYVGVHADIDQVREIIQEEASHLDNVINRTLENDVDAAEVRVIEIKEGYIHVRAYIWLSEPFAEFKTKCTLKEAVHKRFQKENVHLPIPLHKIVE
ncbi:mechanosensitive ion channel family protein [uncultured Kordia sp.]|uniref:mechanosensitive ion channel family protein n=1 Tax=uncultured Kordia sp. TaxID=507699 RepID=UPI002617A74E|nr:mechanosensitive ion channel family protein [uncultured Kordia sp.]